MIIWLASYPRSGNTFTRAVFNHYFGLKSLSVHGDRFDIAADEHLRKLIGHADGDLSSLDLPAMRHSPESFFIKTHHVPCEYMHTKDRVVYIVRNGLNSCLSYMNYLHKIANASHVSLQDVVSGRVGFGLWGRHVLRWKQAKFSEMHFYKFEQIVVDPDRFADDLACMLDRSRSKESFPKFSEFKAINSNFFSSGQVVMDKEAVSDNDQAVFEMFNDVGMRLAGYSDLYPDENEMAAYSLFCDRIEWARVLEAEKAEEIERSRKEHGMRPENRATLMKRSKDTKKTRTIASRIAKKTFHFLKALRS